MCMLLGHWPIINRWCWDWRYHNGRVFCLLCSRWGWFLLCFRWKMRTRIVTRCVLMEGLLVMVNRWAHIVSVNGARILLRCVANVSV